MNIDKVKTRIQKLLAMAQDTSSPHEAAIAATRVQKLMAQFNLEMVDVIAEELNNEDNIIAMKREFRYKRTPSYISWIETAIAKAFNCEVRGEPEGEGDDEFYQTTFYGYKSDVEIATWLCAYISDQLENMAKKVKIPEQYQQLRVGRRYMSDWRKGAAMEICNRIRAFYANEEEADVPVACPITSAGFDLVELKKDAIVKKYGRFHYGKTKSRRYTQDGMVAGRAAAESISISRVIDGDNRALEHL